MYTHESSDVSKAVLKCGQTFHYSIGSTNLPDGKHQEVPNRSHNLWMMFVRERSIDKLSSHQCGNRTCWNTVLQEVNVGQVQLTHIIFLRRSAIRYANVREKRKNGGRRSIVNRTYAVWFGKPDTGIPMPVEQRRPVKKIKRRWCLPPSKLLATSFAIGTRSTLAMVWLMKVEITYAGVIRYFSDDSK